MGNGILQHNRATIVPTVTNENASYPKGNLINNDPKNPFKTTTITENTITWDFGVSVLPTAIFIVNHSQPDTSFKFESSSDNFASTQSTQDIPIDTINSFVFYTGLIRRYMRIRMEDSANIQSLGEVYFALSGYEFLINYNQNFKGGPKRVFNIHGGEAGRIFKKFKFKKFNQDLFFERVEEAQKDTFNLIGLENFVIYLPKGVTGAFYFGVIDFETEDNIGILPWYNIDGKFEESL